MELDTCASCGSDVDAATLHHGDCFACWLESNAPAADGPYEPAA